MRDLSPAAKAYIWAMLILGAGVLVASRPALPDSEGQQFAFIILTAAAAIAHLFPVVTSKNQAYYVTPVFVFAGLLLLSQSALTLLIILAFIPVWVRGRYPWHIQLFNISNLLVDTYVARMVFVHMGGSRGSPLEDPTILIGALVAVGLFTLLNHLLLAIVLRLAYGSSWSETRLFDVDTLLVDATLSCTGIITALLWEVSPWLTVLAVAPPFLIYRALYTANLQEQARTDAKTGLYNSRHFYQVLEEEFRRAVRFRRPLTIIMADLDLLRNINNAYGHLAGDAVLKGVAQIITAGLRKQDLAARFGGEEFVIVLPETDSDQALSVAQRLRKQVEETPFKFAAGSTPIRATLSLGIASFPIHGSEAMEIIDHADLAVYYAKLQGRNRVWVCSNESMALRATMDGRLSVRESAEDAATGAPALAELPVAVGAAVGLAAGRTTEPAVERAAPGGLPEAAEDRTTVEESVPLVPGAPGEALFRRGMMADAPSLLAILLLATVAAGAVALWDAYRPWEASLDWVGLGALAVLVLVTQGLAIGSRGPGRMQAGSIFVLAGGMLFGAPGALLLVPVFALSKWILRGGTLYGALFDLGGATLWSVAAVVAFAWLSAWPWAAEPGLFLLPAVLAGLTYYAVDTGLYALAMGLQEKASPLRIWQQRFGLLLLYYVAFSGFALLIALAYSAVGLYGLLPFVIPLFILHHGAQQAADSISPVMDGFSRSEPEPVPAFAAEAGGLGAQQPTQATYDATIMELSVAMDRRESEIAGHAQRVAAYAELIARDLGLAEEQTQDLIKGALLHDIGKTRVPDAILRKPGPLALSEWTIMRMHPEQGYQMVQHLCYLGDALLVIRHHHERYDGRGYPLGLKGQDIPLLARVFAVADALDAITTEHPYRPAYPVEVAREEISRCAGSQFDPRIVESFLRVDVRELARICATAVERGASGESEGSVFSAG